jgi:epoxyqueuosine reductase
MSEKDNRHAGTLTSADVKSKARSLGFEACGISKAEELSEEARRLETWLNRGYHGTMSWMERHFDKRIDPRKLVPGAKSIISVMDVYYQAIEQPDSPEIGRVSRYAWGQDYHVVVKDRLHVLFDWIERQVGDVAGRVFVDSAPVMDKAWAARSGLGWIGKHSNLLNTKLGSWFFLGEIICNVELEADGPIPDHCGTCTRCIDACPTGAIVEPYVVDANRCISYLTIEHREDNIRTDLVDRMGNWIFGCDICQDVCPWNKFSPTTAEPAYLPSDNIESTTLEDWSHLTASEFEARFSRSAISRARPLGFARNVRLALSTEPPRDKKAD